MEFISLFILFCAIVNPSLGASLHDKQELADMEHKLEDLEKSLEEMKLQSAFQQHDSMTRFNDIGRSGFDDLGRIGHKHSDPALFKNHNSKEQKFRPEPPGKSPMEKVLLYTNDADATVKEVTSMGGKVLLYLGKELVVAKIHGKVKDHLQSALTEVPESASSSTLNYAKAYKKSVQMRAAERSKVHNWANEASHALPRLSPHRASTKLTMTGKIAVALIMPSGPTPDIAFCEDEVENAVSQAITGLDFWAEQAPDAVELDFTLYRAVVDIDVEDSEECTSYEQCHNHYAVPAIESLGFTGDSLIGQIEDVIMEMSGATGAFVSFITKYKQFHFAYAYFGGGPTFMEYSNDGWGTDNIDRVYAHEVGHVFNTPDEYGGCDCNRQYGRGSCTELNSNCITCTEAQQECVMGTAEFEVCEYTRKHIGWCGDDGDGCRK